MKEEIIQWLESGADYQTGCVLFAKYSKNMHARKFVYTQRNNFPAVRIKLQQELCKLADIDFNPLKPDELKKKSENIGQKTETSRTKSPESKKQNTKSLSSKNSNRKKTPSNQDQKQNKKKPSTDSLESLD